MVWGFGLRVSGVGFGVWGLGLRVEGNIRFLERVSIRSLVAGAN